MKNSRRIFSIFLLIVLSSIGVSAKAQRQSSRVNSRQVSDILQRLAQSSARFRNSLNNGIDWQWNQQTLPPVSTSRSHRLSDREFDQLILRIEAGGDTFRSSLTDAFDRSRYDPTRSEGRMNDAVARFKKASDQLRNRFNARQSVPGDIQHLLEQAAPVDAYMRKTRLTVRAQNDWSTLRDDLEGLASAYNTVPNWNVGTGSQPVLTNTASSSGDFIVRDGESVVAVLNNDLTSSQSKQILSFPAVRK